MKPARQVVDVPRALMTDPLEVVVRSLLKVLGEDPDREGLRRTPNRVARSLRSLTQGYHEATEDLLKGAIFAEDHEEMVTIRDIGFYSLCEHHLLPFFGKCHVAYIPKRRVIGISKIARLVEAFARRLQVQERLTNQIASTIQKVLEPQGVAVVILAQHLCMQMRGVQKQGSAVVTSSMQGAFRSKQATREEFMNLIRS